MARLLDTIIDGEDEPITSEHRDDAGNLIAPDDTTADPEITITDEAGTEVVSGVVMNELQAGEYEYVWDSAADGTGRGLYTAEVSADFNSETDIARAKVRVE